MIQKKLFIGGMDSDTTDELMPEGRDRYRLNVRVLSAEGDSVGAIETLNGNTLVSYTLPAGTNTVIGAKEYPKTNKVYYFVANSIAANCSILEYNIATNAIQKVIQGSFLKFSTTYLITGINFIELDVNNHLIYWTDDLNPPRKINIEKAIYHSNGNYTLGYPTPFNEEWICRIKVPPAAPSFKWFNDATRSTNWLLNKNFQFKVKFVYDDNDVSSFSPFSTYTYPETDYVGNNASDTYTHDNGIRITFPTGSAIVKKIVIAAKQANTADYYVNTNNDFIQIAEIDKEQDGLGNDTTATYDFYNDGTYIPINVNESIKLFDNVPKRSKSQELIAGNRLVDGLITEGFDQVEIDLGLDLAFQDVDNSTPNPGPMTSGSYLKAGEVYNLGIVYYNFANQSGTVNINRGKYNEVQPNGRLGTSLTIPFLTESGYTPAKMNSAPEVSWNIYNQAPSWATHYQILRSKGKVYDKYFQFVAESIIYYGDDSSTILPDPTVLAPYYMSVRILNIVDRYNTEYPLSKLVYGFTPGDRIRMISNPPYADAPYLGDPKYLLPAGSSTTYGSLPDTINLAYNDYEIVSFDEGKQLLKVKLGRTTPFHTWPEVYAPGCLYEVYTPRPQVAEDQEIMYEIGEVHEVESVGGYYIHKGVTADQNIQAGTSTATTGFLATNTITITVPNGHGFVVTNKVKVVGANGWSCYATVTTSAATQIIVTLDYDGVGSYANSAVTVSTAAIGTFSTGDSFRPYQNMPFYINPTQDNGGDVTIRSEVYRWYCHVENMNINNFNNIKAWDYARPNRVDPDAKEITRPSTVIYSEAFVPETNINGLSTVYDTSFQTYEDKYGGIYKLYNEDQRLIVFQELKVGALPVNQVIYNDLQGLSTVGASPEVLSPQMIYFAGEFGIGRHPESFAVYGYAKYFFDLRRGEILRLSNDGITPLASTYFMKNNVTDQCEAMLKSTSRVPAYGVYDIKFDEYILAIPRFSNRDSDNNPAVTLAFNEKNNAFSTFYSYAPEFMCSMGINIMSFKSGALWTHNTKSTQNNFYGVQYESRIYSIMNADPSKVKVLEAISEECSDVWHIDKILTPNGQESNIVAADFEEKENNQYAFVWRDINTPNLVAGTALFEGDPMRDRVFEVRFHYGGTTFTKLFAVNYIYSNSERSNK